MMSMLLGGEMCRVKCCIVLIVTLSLSIIIGTIDGVSQREGRRASQPPPPEAKLLSASTSLGNQLAHAILTPRTSTRLVEATYEGVDQQAAVFSESLQQFPLSGNQYIVLSSGKADDVPGGATTFSSIDMDGIDIPGGSPDGLDAYDVVTLKLKLDLSEVPAGSSSQLSFQFKFCTEEAPTWWDSKYRDFFTAIIKDASGQTIKNIALLPNGDPFTIYNARPYMNQVEGSSPDPEPPFPDPNDVVFNACTGFHTATFNFEALIGQEIEIEFQLGDVSDAIYDSAVFIDSLDIPTAELPDFTISKIEFNQAIQKYDDNDKQFQNPQVSLVAGKPTVARIYLDIGPSNETKENVSAKLYVLKNGQAIPESPFFPEPERIVPPKEPSRQNTNHTLNFYLPGKEAGEYQYYAVVDPDNEVLELSENNNRFPESGYATFTFTKKKNFKVLYYEINGLSSNENTTFAQQRSFPPKLYPTGKVNYVRGGEHDWDGDLSNRDERNKLFRWLKFRRALYNIFHFLSPANSVAGILPEDGLGGTTTGWGERPGTAVLVTAEFNSTFVHELGHNLGLGHDNNALGEGGFDVVKKEVASSGRANFMRSFASNTPWVNENTYQDLLSEDDFQAEASTTMSASANNGDYLIISLYIEDNTVNIYDFYKLPGPATATAFEGGPYKLEFHDQAHNILTGYNFSLPRLDEGDITPVVFTVPYLADTKYIVIKHPGTAGQPVAQQADVIGSITVSNNPPNVTVVSPNGGESISEIYTIAWTANDPDGDALTYTVLYSSNGATWNIIASDLTTNSFEWDSSTVPGGSNALIKVIATDGVNTGQDQSDAPFMVTTKPPSATILSPEGGQTKLLGEMITFVGTGIDLEDGTLSGAQLEWSSSIDGAIGTGETLSTSDLSAGQHSITLTSTDNDSNTGSDIITVTVIDSVPPPPTGIEAFPGNKQVRLEWDPSPSEYLAGYKLYYGTSSGIYGDQIDVGNVTSYTVTGLMNDITYYFAVTAYDTIGNESGFSEEISATPENPGTPAVFRVTREGNVYADQAYYGQDFLTGGADIAERIKVSEPVEPSDVVALDPDNPGQYRKSRKPYSTLASGVISTQPGFTLGIDKSQWDSQRVNFSPLFNPKLILEDVSFTNLSESPANYTRPGLDMDLTLETITQQRTSPNQWSLPNLSLSGFNELLHQKHIEQILNGKPMLALMGVVPVKATIENGPIKPGDLLTSSSTPGYVMRCKDKKKCAGAIVGKALEPLDEGIGVIKMLVMR